MLRSRSRRSKRSCIRLGPARAAGFGKVIRTNARNTIERGGRRIKRRIIRSLSSTARRAGGRLASAPPEGTSSGGLSNRPTRVLLGRKKGAPPRRRRFRFSIHRGYGAPVLRIGLFAPADNGRTLLAVADRRDAGCRNTRGDQDILYRLGAAFAEREVVFARAALARSVLRR